MITRKDCHLIIDASNPFLVESISNKNIEELSDYILQLYRELSTVHSSNKTRQEFYANTIRTAEAFQELKRINDLEDNGKGYSIV
jgi:hypothetical protein